MSHLPYSPSLSHRADVPDDDLPSIFGISTVKLGDDTAASLADSEVALRE